MPQFHMILIVSILLYQTQIHSVYTKKNMLLHPYNHQKPSTLQNPLAWDEIRQTFEAKH